MRRLNLPAPLLLTVAALAASLWAAYEGRAVNRYEPKTLELQTAPTAAKAREVLNGWNCSAIPGEPCKAAGESLHADSRLIAAYVTAGILAAFAAVSAAGAPLWWGWILAGFIVTAGMCDLAENWLMALCLGTAPGMWLSWVFGSLPGLAALPGRNPVPDQAFAFIRLASMTKFTLLLTGGFGILAIALGAFRVALVRRKSPAAGQPAETLGSLIKKETEGIFRHCRNRSTDDPQCSVHAAADEAFVNFREADVVGLALSGGGIRSATFNLGLLQGLHKVRLLPLVDYLSTVSGGGYVGAFWSAWLKRQAEPHGSVAPEKLFPAAATTSNDTDEVRHLREFSGFLAPRWGFFTVESWTAIVAVVSGLVPALIIALAVIAAAWIGWLALTFPLASGSPWASALVIGFVTLLGLGAFELAWHKLKQESAGKPPTGKRKLPFRAIAFGAMVLAILLQAGLPAFYQTQLGSAWPMLLRLDPPMESGLTRWFALTGIDVERHIWVLSPRLFDYGAVWLASGLIFVIARFFTNSFRSCPRHWLAAFDRVLMRLLGLGVLWCVSCALWHAAINLESLAAVAGTAIASAGAFAALRNWMSVAVDRPRESGILHRLKPYLPQVLAYLTVSLTAVIVGRGLIAFAGSGWMRWWSAAACTFFTLIVTLFVKPEKFGLHQFYRDRISRAYLGACNLGAGEGAGDNRATEYREGDEISLSDLVERPLHLVCCAANDLSGDQVETLGRGARSAVLSRYGLSLGQYSRELTKHSEGDWLGSAVTASAAAFNSNMGHVSASVGPVVSFLMTALNLRLGLWLRHPAAGDAGPRRWPGLLYYREMFGLTSSSGRVDGRPSVLMRDVHLSDGGHFENLALYELVRRHCRYIVVSDCGSDPTLAFSDLGNAIRRVREDFGVDIELDVTPLRPGSNSLSRQHIVAGTIHYSQTDKGILLYFKPTITGDEPADIVQYRNRNNAFPHESTVDQVYDEAQWEAYRRLGLHAAETAFEFTGRLTETDHKGDIVFAQARRQWGPTPEGLEAQVLKMTERFGALESELHQMQSRGLLRDVFPEIDCIIGPPNAAIEHTEEQSAAELTTLLRMIQLMEDVWLTCALDKWWAHPLNIGWINLFARWATSPAFRFWWPLLSPMYSDDFRQFMTNRFPTRATGTAHPHDGEVERIGNIKESKGLAAVWCRERSAHPIHREQGWQFYQNMLTLHRGGAGVKIQAGIAAVTRSGTIAGWTSDDFFVPPSLWGAGIGSRFLRNLLHKLHEEKSTLCYVVVKAPLPGARHRVALDDRRSYADQYRRLGFSTAREGEEKMLKALDYQPNDDTLMRLDLVQWIRHESGEPPKSGSASAGGS